MTVHTPQVVQRRQLMQDIERYLAFVEEARTPLEEVSMPATYENACHRADELKYRNPETPGPGRLEGNDDRLLAEMLEELAGDTSYLDEEEGEVDVAGWIGRIGRFCVSRDDNGFFYYQDFGNETAAHVAFETVRPSYEVVNG